MLKILSAAPIPGDMQHLRDLKRLVETLLSRNLFLPA